MQKEAGREPWFRLTVEMTPLDLAWMLENSGYSTPLGPGHALSISTIAVLIRTLRRSFSTPAIT
ncbi:hypothetical protein [Nocardia sp. NBC_00416]|uniref:hypothetical protein n=1 Tax=Nocardia sp. NBC_00416 TaxID=2975991 RepID=UPI002E240706